MSSYYKHSYTQRAKVPYSFVCEHCGQNSGVLHAEMEEKVSTTTPNYRKELSPEEKNEMTKKAIKKLAKYIDGAKEEAEKQVYSFEFKNICPHCNKSQSWALSRIEGAKYINATLLAILGIIISFFGYSIIGSLLKCAILVVSLFFVGGIIGHIRVALLKKKTESILEKGFPEIQWDKVI